MVNDCLVFFVCYREGWGGMKASSSECHRDTIGSFIIRLANFFVPRLVHYLRLRQNYFKRLIKKMSSEFKMIGYASSFFRPQS